jgi:hypothetical protein
MTTGPCKLRRVACTHQQCSRDTRPPMMPENKLFLRQTFHLCTCNPYVATETTPSHHCRRIRQFISMLMNIVLSSLSWPGVLLASHAHSAVPPISCSATQRGNGGNVTVQLPPGRSVALALCTRDSGCSRLPLTWPQEHPRSGCRPRHHVVGLRPGPAPAMHPLGHRHTARQRLCSAAQQFQHQCKY